MKTKTGIVLAAVTVLLFQSGCSNFLPQPTPTATAVPPTSTPVPPTATPMPPTPTAELCNTEAADKWLFQTDAIMFTSAGFMFEIGGDPSENEKEAQERFRTAALDPDLQNRAIALYQMLVDELEDTTPPPCFDSTKEHMVKGLKGQLEFWQILRESGDFDTAALGWVRTIGFFRLAGEEISAYCRQDNASEYCRLYHPPEDPSANA